MVYLTLAQIKTRIQNETDLFGDTFVTDDGELLSYINAAINDVEAVIHSLYEDYFLVRQTLSLVSGTATVSPPSDIYATKIRSLVYNSTSLNLQYEVRRILRIQEAAKYAQSTSAPYRYIITNDATNGIKINLFPTPTESGAVLDCWYIRNAKTLASDSDSCDIPEFIEFVFSNLKWRVARKEKSGVDLETAQKEYVVQKDLLVQTLTDMVPDESSNLIMKDMSFYNDFDSPLVEDMRRD